MLARGRIYNTTIKVIDYTNKLYIWGRKIEDYNAFYINVEGFSRREKEL